MEKCDSPEGFVVFSGASGACGTAVSSALAQLVYEKYPKQQMMFQSLWPDQTKFANVSSMAPYNFISLFGDLAGISKNITIVPYTNEQLYKHCGAIGDTSVGYTEINRLIVNNFRNMINTREPLGQNIFAGRRMTLT